LNIYENCHLDNGATHLTQLETAGIVVTQSISECAQSHTE